MRVTLLADGRSPITRRWLRSASAAGIEFDLISTFPCPKPPEARGFTIIPLAFSGLAGIGNGATAGKTPAWIKRFRPLLQKVRTYLGPLTIRRQVPAYLRALQEFKPDLVHALRIPYEGMLAAYTPRDLPLVIFIWGNDLTLHAPSSPFLAAATRRALARTDGLMADAARDLTLARQWGLAAETPLEEVPSNGGLDLAEIDVLLAALPPAPDWLPSNRILILNPRGIRPAYVCQEEFFKAAALAVQQQPDLYFLCAAMQDQPQAQAWVKQNQLEGHVRLLPLMEQCDLWALAARCRASVSLAIHDGTPNTLLESMACGCLPIAGDIESLREWIEPQVNGLLVDPRDPKQAAQAMLRAARDERFVAQAKRHNRQLLEQRADMRSVSRKIAAFYQLMLEKKNTG